MSNVAEVIVVLRSKVIANAEFIEPPLRFNCAVLLPSENVLIVPEPPAAAVKGARTDVSMSRQIIIGARRLRFDSSMAPPGA